MTKQVTGYVTPEEREAFEAYGAKFGLDVATLLLLLLIRELRVGRFERLRDRFDAPELPAKVKVTAHVKVATIKSGIMALATHASLSVSRICGILVRAELAEHWLESALELNDSS